ncbi:MAG: sodium:solute symporter family protein [Woeseiaceae bacterium]
MNLQTWSWTFFVIYSFGMLALGVWGSRRVKQADDYAVARKSYGPLALALAFAATTASGATFLGLPGYAYTHGVSVLWWAFGYPIGVYIGVIICLRVVSESGNKFGSRSIPEFLGDRYNSDRIRVIAALMSLILFFYLAGQLVSGLVMFETMLGLSQGPALAITTVVLLLYVTLGGAHADILTDGVQGAVMLLIAVGVAVMFVSGVSVDGGLGGTMQRLGELDPGNLATFNARAMIVATPLAVLAMIIAHIPMGMLPHIGNKLWALDSARSRRRFLVLAFTFAMLLPAMTLGGLLARVHLGDALLDGGAANQAIPALFIAVLPTALAALLCIAVLCAVMSTADGLVVSSAQVFANDLYRRTFAKRWSPELSGEALDRRVLLISRWATVGVLAGSAGVAWMLLDVNIALLVWMGIGGMTAALAGPLLLGSLWSGVTERGAMLGMLTGFITFAALHSQVLPVYWLATIGPNPFYCATLGSLSGVAITVIVSRLWPRPQQ